MKRKYQQPLDVLREERNNKERLEYEEQLRHENERLRHEELKRKEEEQRKIEEIEKKKKEQKQRIDEYEKNKLKAKQEYDKLKKIDQMKIEKLKTKNKDQMAVGSNEEIEKIRNIEEEIKDSKKSTVEINTKNVDQLFDKVNDSKQESIGSTQKDTQLIKTEINSGSKNKDQITDENKDRSNKNKPDHYSQNLKHKKNIETSLNDDKLTNGKIIQLPSLPSGDSKVPKKSTLEPTTSNNNNNSNNNDNNNDNNNNYNGKILSNDKIDSYSCKLQTSTTTASVGFKDNEEDLIIKQANTQIVDKVNSMNIETNGKKDIQKNESRNTDLITKQPSPPESCDNEDSRDENSKNDIEISKNNETCVCSSENSNHFKTDNESDKINNGKNHANTPLQSHNKYDLKSIVHNTKEESSEHSAKHDIQITVHSREDNKSIAHRGDDADTNRVVHSDTIKDDKVQLPSHLIGLFNSWLEASAQVKRFVYVVF